MPVRKEQKLLRSIHKLITKYLVEEDLKTLCFYLGEDYSSLSGEGKTGKARELIINCSRKGWVEDLLQELEELRPNVNWPKIDFEQTVIT